MASGLGFDVASASARAAASFIADVMRTGTQLASIPPETTVREALAAIAETTLTNVRTVLAGQPCDNVIA